MKILKHLALAALVVAGLLLPASMTRPQPVSASCGLFVDIVTFGITAITDACAPFSSGDSGPPAPSCNVGNYSVSATPQLATYTYDLTCTVLSKNVPTLQVTGTNDYNTGKAHEELTRDAFKTTADWKCFGDPWTVADPLPCARLTLFISGHNNSEFDLSQQTVPFSTQYLVPDQRHALYAALVDALNEAAAKEAAKQAAILAAIEVTSISANKATECVICSALGTTPAPAPAPTLPDFKIMAVRAAVPNLDPVTNKELLANGVTAGYEVVVANLGAKMPQLSTDPSKKPQVQVSIQVTGSLQYAGMDKDKIPAGFDCSGTGPVICVGPLGGYGDAVQDTVVTIPLKVLGAKVGVGVGSISAAADPNGLIKESDVTNNAYTLAITVK